MSQIVTFHKLVPEGKALGYWHDKALFASGPLPGETAEVAITREKRDWAEARVRRFITTSPERREPSEAHFLSCSPWQNVAYDRQIELKRALLQESFHRHEGSIEVLNYVASPKSIGYRNKLEFSFVVVESGRVELAFHERGSWKSFVAAPAGCVLGSEEMNARALEICERINELGLAKVVKTLTVRQSQTYHNVIAVLQLNAKASADWSALGGTKLSGLAVVVQPRHNVFELLFSAGELTLTERVGDVELRYPWDSFFQVNLPAFSQALASITSLIEPGERVVDLYGGAGTIGLPVARVAREVIGVEIVPSSVELANLNAERNGLSNYRASAVASEKLDLALLDGVDSVIVDPPRPGLSKRVVSYLTDSSVKKIIYLSCNPVTQARDVALLSEAYRPSGVTGFDFYPGTHHQESLMLLERSA